MPSDFAEAGKRLETAIPVPELSIASIRNRARVESAQQRARALVFSVVAAIAILGSGTVLAAMNYGGVRLWLSGDKATLLMRSFTTINAPSADDVRRVAASATFPVVFPAGIPSGMHLYMLFVSPADHPNFMLLQYRNGRTGSSWGFLLFDSSRVNAGEIPTLPNGQKPLSGRVTHWTVGRETIVTSDPFVRTHVAEVQAAMSRLTPAQSVEQMLPMLYRVIPLGGLSRVIDAAEAIAPAQGRSVLVDRGNLGQIAMLAREHKALFSIKTITVDNLPMVGGKPDFAHQSSHVDKELALSAGGVSALATVLSTNVCGSAGTMGGSFTCEMLINERRGQPYRIWVLPLNSPTPTAKYTVDATSFRIAQ